MPNKKVVLDSNEIILGLKQENAHSKNLLDQLNRLKERYEFLISDDIHEEAARNLPHHTKELWRRLLDLGVISVIHYVAGRKLLEKYKWLGLKKGDIAIAAFVDEENAQFLVSENRHFLKELKINKFRILNAEQFLKEVLK